jgi:hypothetical protein
LCATNTISTSLRKNKKFTEIIWQLYWGTAFLLCANMALDAEFPSWPTAAIATL